MIENLSQLLVLKKDDMERLAGRTARNSIPRATDPRQIEDDDVYEEEMPYEKFDSRQTIKHDDIAESNQYQMTNYNELQGKKKPG